MPFKWVTPDQSRSVSFDPRSVSRSVCKMVLCEPDASGRRRPECSGEEFILDVDQVIMAIGQTSNPILVRSIKGLNLRGAGYIGVDENGASNIPGIFAGGYISTGAATVISAMGAGKRAARAIHSYITTLR